MNRLQQTDKIEKAAIKAHAVTNHYYDKYLPYEFHLRMVVTNGVRHWQTLNTIAEHYGTINFDNWDILKDVEPVLFTPNHIIAGHWFHDGVEDARLTFNDIVEMTSIPSKNPNLRDPAAALIAIACTSDPTGLNKDERMNESVFKRIRNTPGATATKLDDRIANVQYGVMTGGSMPRKYKKSNERFLEGLQGTEEFILCKPLIEDLHELFKQVK